MAAVLPEDWVLETASGPVNVSWPEPGDVIDDPPVAHFGLPRISFGYSVADAPRIEPLAGTSTWMRDSRGHQLRVRIDRVDPMLKVVVGEVEVD